MKIFDLAQITNFKLLKMKAKFNNKIANKLPPFQVILGTFTANFEP